MIEDKTVLGDNENTRTPSKAFREYIESLVEEVVLNKSVFNNHKKYLQRYCQEEGLDYALLEKNLTDFFETIEELKSHKSKVVERFAKMLSKDCYLEEGKVDELVSAINEALEKEEAERKAKEEAERLALAAAQARKESERKAREEKEHIAREEEGHKAREEAEHQEKIKKAEALFQQWANYYPPGTGCDYKMLEKKIPLLMESAALGYPKAQNYLSQAYRMGLGVKRNSKESFRLAMASALQNSPGGQLLVGIEYLYGGEVEPNDELAFSWLSKSAQAGNPDGMVYLAICYQHGIGVARNLGYANKLISQAKEIAPKRASYFSRIIDYATDEHIKNERKSYYENHK